MRALVLKTEKEKEYFDYIKEHISNVMKAFDMFGETLCKELKVSPETIKKQCLVHDQSKYSSEEFEAYRQWFFPEEGEEKNREIFDKAWFHHYSVNKHHPEFWSLSGKLKKMPDNYIIEMLLDWAAMSMKFKNSPVDWWNSNKGKFNFHPETFENVSHLMSLPIWKNKIFESEK